MATRASLAALRTAGIQFRGVNNLRVKWPRICRLSFDGTYNKYATSSRVPVTSFSARFASTQSAAVESSKYSEKVIEKARYDQGSDMLVTEWQGGEQMDFPILWLRDNCQCSACFHSSAIARTFVMTDMDLGITPKTVKTSNGELNITWSDGHQSTFTSPWLYERRFTQDARDELKRWLPRKPVMWGPDKMQNKVLTDTFDRIMNDDRALHDWLCSLEDTGLFLVTGAPTDDLEGQNSMVRELGNRVAFLKTTNYGEEFVVKAKVDASNAAYTDVTLGLHTDLPYYHYCPGVQMLMCVKQVPTKGGENQFADGFHVAEIMREKHPEEFKLLTTVPVRFIDIGHDYYEFHKLYSGPVITLDDDGEITRVTYNDQVRDSAMTVPAEEVTAFYKALKLYNILLYENHVTLKLKPGDIICFHNYRVLHGRSGFQALADGERHLGGGYIDWDELYSRRRVLQKKLNL